MEEKKGLSLLLTKLLKLQAMARAEKGQRNNFGKYNYRTLSDIFEAIKQLMYDLGLVFVFSDTVELIGGEPYLVSTGTLFDTDTGESLEVKAVAREPLNQSGMSSPQMTGSAVTYCHKYLLTSLLNLVDHEMDAMLDPDAQEPKKDSKPKAKEQKKGVIVVGGKELPKDYYDACMYVTGSGERLGDLYKKNRENFDAYASGGDLEVRRLCAVILNYKLTEESSK